MFSKAYLVRMIAPSGTQLKCTVMLPDLPIYIPFSCNVKQNKTTKTNKQTTNKNKNKTQPAKQTEKQTKKTNNQPTKKPNTFNDSIT